MTDLITKKLNNGLEITIRKTNTDYGMWRIGYDSLGRNKRTASRYLSGEFTSPEEAKKALDLYLKQEGLQYVG